MGETVEMLWSESHFVEHIHGQFHALFLILSYFMDLEDFHQDIPDSFSWV